MSRFTHPAIFDGGLANLVVPHAQFISLQTQQALVPSVTQAVMLETTVFSQGVTIENGTEGYLSRITFENSGVYNIAFSGQLHHLGGGGPADTIFMWFRHNGIDIADSNTRITVPNGKYAVAAWNIFVSAEAGDYVELVGHPDNISIVLEYIASNAHPATPSVILTVNQVA